MNKEGNRKMIHLSILDSDLLNSVHLKYLVDSLTFTTSVLQEHELRDTLSNIQSGHPPQLTTLLEDDPLKTFCR